MSEKPRFDQDIHYDEDSGDIVDHSTSRGFPLGGLGTGGFSVFTDGGFGMFRTNNNWFNTPAKAKHPRGTFLAVRAETGEHSVARILRRGYTGLEPAVSHDRALRHSEWQSKLLVDSYRLMKSRAGRTRPLVYREADRGGNEIPALHRGFKLYGVNNPWQSIAYQGVEAVFLGRTYMTRPLLWIWDKDHHGTEGHVYMTHPSMWSVLAAITGVTYDAFVVRRSETMAAPSPFDTDK